MNFLREVARTLAAYIRGEIRIIAILAILYLLGFVLLGVPLWPLWALLAALSHPIPFAGVIFGLLAPLVATWAKGGDPWLILGVVGVFVAIQTLEGFVLTPRILGKSLRISALTVFVCTLLGGALFGPLGMLFAAPVAAVAAVIWRFTMGREQER